jgi:hypothetical protein
MGKQSRDMSKAQFDKELAKRGWTREGFLGYVRMPLPGGGAINISRLNAGPRLRSQLAYLIAEFERVEDREAARAAGAGA